MPNNDALRGAAGLLRIAASSGLSTAQWLMNRTVQTGSRVARGIAAGEPAARIVNDLGAELRSAARETLGIPDDPPPPPQPSTEDLRARGAELLRQSADVHFVEGTHPAYARILDELTPDEARILRLLALEGPQPMVDVRTNRPLGVGSELIEAGLSMIGRQAGIRNLSRTNAHLNNLFRLGLIWFSPEEVEPERYQLIEVQPEVQTAMTKAGRGPKTIRRSIHLTPFGQDFTHSCLPLP
jgi:Abortive infection alpha